MPRLSLWRANKQNDYRFLDRNISEMLTVGGTDLYIHKYTGITNQGPSVDPTQPQYLEPSPTQIQDLLFLENRNRKYDPDIYRLRGHYNVQNLDFDLSQFGLFLNNNIIFVVVHYNDMIDIIGRKLMVGDVLELPHLLDYNPLDETIPVALKRFMQITDANFASEGFTQTWYPHLWRIKCEPLVNSEEFADILNQPINKDNYLGDYDPGKTYPPGYTVTYGGVVYQSTQPVPPGIYPPNAAFWDPQPNNNLSNIISTYNKNIAINDAVLKEAEELVPKSGYDTSKLYVIPTYGTYSSNGVLSKQINEPAPPYDIVVDTANAQTMTIPVSGNVVVINNPQYKSKAAGIRISQRALQNIWNMGANPAELMDKINLFRQTQLYVTQETPERTGTGSGLVSGLKTLVAESMGVITGPYGTADNTYATADQDPVAPGFSGEVTINMDYRADCVPGFQYITRSTPRSFGYSAGYMTGDGTAPNGFEAASGISFPQDPQVGDYFLRIDYLPQLLYRWDGALWIQISQNVRTQTGFGSIANESLLSSFINNPQKIYLNNEQAEVPEAQPLSSILQPPKPKLPPKA